MEDCKEATHKEICDRLRKHYEEISNKACHWASGIVHAIDAYEREPDLQQQLHAAQQRVVVLESKFNHYHVNAHDGTDRCYTCGFDLRDELHRRIPDDRPKPIII